MNMVTRIGVILVKWVVNFKYRMMRNIMKRWFKKLRIKLLLRFRTNVRCRFPKNITNKERTVYEIFIKILHDPDTKLYYNTTTRECSMKSEKQSLWIFLEERNVKVINSTFGYDRTISSELECYLSERFIHENTKRRVMMKEEALSRVEHSLSKTRDKLLIKS